MCPSLVLASLPWSSSNSRGAGSNQNLTTKEMLYVSIENTRKAIKSKEKQKASIRHPEENKLLETLGPIMQW